MAEEKVACRTPAVGRDGVTNVPKWKYDLLAGHILSVVSGAGTEGFLFSGLKDAVKSKLTEDELDCLGSPGWHVTVVKLNMEVTGQLVRLDKMGPQRLVIA